ncbi:predicted protein [Phaeodactylum tricornutum CCAP 1055/1]|uniref:Uncharacterized protein n=2 Tax=Phaeodactylum tricornutum TaxID=2850 RepID=B7FQH7_PHATC|nr:predicted protein [Phaeodactylum tricornutum CCAP 1055/1]EEC51336.1 predicted protein [Phaeodactylum tricornutum CCAP 1055/1]|eukprot:XP_002176873.1 predicted protein [Phaeodactylum tricornutum CCAP 1055/1]
MKLALLFTAALYATSATAFSVAPSIQPRSSAACTTSTARSMFGGAGEGMPNEDDPEQLKQMEQAAKSMGMNLEEYKLGISARARLTKELDAARITSGNKANVSIERDGNNPPKLLEISITEDGKKLGKEALSKEL